MATMLLSAAGSSLGGFAGGSFLGMGAASLGKAAGAVVGGLIDQQVLGRGGQSTSVGRVDRLRIQSGGEGAPIPRLYGRMRIGGQLIWSARFLETVDVSRQGGKGGGPKVREYSYTVSFAVALCEGPIRRIGRVWADGNEISLADLTYRVHRGFPGQAPDPLIDDIEGGAPAFRDLAYIVFEDMPIGVFGNRIPQLNIEVYREPQPGPHVDPTESAPPLSELVRGVALSPGSGEFSLDTEKVRRVIGPGRTAYENVNTLGDRPDVLIGLDQLEAEAPNCNAVSLIVSWFGDDLRCGSCQIQPCVENDDKETDPSQWRVSGVGRGDARRVSLDAEDRPIYGGTPSDASVLRAIQELKSRGQKVMFYPFILMDIPPGGSAIDPWTGVAGQPPFPWRGRITLNRAPGVAGSADKTAAAADEVDAFFGAAEPGDFASAGETVNYSGPAEWSFRRFILHYARLCAMAGGVDSFCIGSEMRSLTQIRSGPAFYPSVQQLRALAADVRAIVGPDVKVGYAADWSEYFGHQPQDGSGDVFFHLDPLWADDDIDFVGIDNYLPLSDWRYREGHADAAVASSVYSLAYLKGNIEGGEGYDWFYANAADRDAQTRSPISDGAHNEDWIFRPKDIRSWWSNPHHNRPGGVRNASSTAWIPGSKPVWFTEIGCPSVDLGANQPNVFVDPKSSENALPYYSRGVRDDYMQRRFLQAALSFWDDPANNPVSSVYGGAMVDISRTFVWTWDVRPWPDYPNRRAVWSDGENHRLGHWITGRLGAASLSEIVAEICEEGGVSNYDVSELRKVVQGYLREDERTGRDALQALMMVYAFDAVESEGRLKFRHRDQPSVAVLDLELAVLNRDGGAELQRQRAPEGEMPGSVRLGYIDSDRDYESGAVEATTKGGASTRVETIGAPVVLDQAAALDIAARYAAEAVAGREAIEISCARRLIALEPGDVVAFAESRYRVETIEDSNQRSAVLSRIEPGVYAAPPRRVRPPEPAPVYPASPVVSRFLDLPLIDGDENGPKIAAFADPWAGTATLFTADGDDEYSRNARVGRPATMGFLAAPLAAAAPDIWTRSQQLDVSLFGGGLSARPDLSVLNGANAAAIRSPSGEWEIIQFASAEMVGENLWRLRRLLRGQFGTEAFIGDPTPEGAEFVLLNDALEEVASPPAFRSIERDWLIGPTRKPYSHDSYVAFSAADDAIRLRPYAPAHLRGERNPATGDVELSWVRRTRVGGDSWAGIETPLGETREAYRVRIAGAGEHEVETSNWTWTATEIADAGSSGAVEVSVSQISDQYGPGPETKVIVNV